MEECTRLSLQSSFITHSVEHYMVLFHHEQVSFEDMKNQTTSFLYEWSDTLISCWVGGVEESHNSMGSSEPVGNLGLFLLATAYSVAENNLNKWNLAKETKSSNLGRHVYHYTTNYI